LAAPGNAFFGLFDGALLAFAIINISLKAQRLTYSGSTTPAEITSTNMHTLITKNFIYAASKRLMISVLSTQIMQTSSVSMF